MARAGFDPRASQVLWCNMAAASGGQPHACLSTHPSHDDRTEALAADMEAALTAFAAARAAGRRPDCRPP